MHYSAAFTGSAVYFEMSNGIKMQIIPTIFNSRVAVKKFMIIR